jgi:hypothetical protein
MCAFGVHSVCIRCVCVCRFSSWDNTQFGDSFSAVTESVPEGWSVVDPWMTLANEVGLLLTD